MYTIINGLLGQNPSIDETIGLLPKEERQAQGWSSKFVIDESIEIAFEDRENDTIHVPPPKPVDPIITEDLISTVIDDIKDTYKLTDEEIRQIMQNYITGNS